MQEFMKLKYFSVTKILSPTLHPTCLSLSYHITGFVQKHENESPGLFSVFKDSITLAFSQFFILFAGSGDSEIGRTSFLSPEHFHYGIDKYRDYR